ncbi:hypothetical protein [Arthrobacter rhizosphaerae]|uniref:hypothetical protein n=1 Tax=Arthrobacter rhizosphaerae TaxID=2855490 RepID=UPI001FF5C375|nr:hypothetical protein [Arthrobacter rhizosphaerae]
MFVAAAGVRSTGFSTASRRVLLRRIAAGVGATSALGAVSGARLAGAVSGAAAIMGAVWGAAGTSKAGRLSLLRRGAEGTTGAVGTVVETGSVEAVPAGGISASGLVGVRGLVTVGAASARCRPARKGRD